MVASLQTRKEALEAKLKEKTKELKKLCIEEAELTGALPPETPLEPGESPPQIRRRVGTTFPLPETLIDKIHSKEAIATLEVDFKIQSGIAEAALGIANDLSSSKSVRRKHKIIYQETQRRLFDLESKLNTLKLSQTKKPPSEADTDCTDGEVRDVNSNSMAHPVLSHSLSDQGLPYVRHHHHPYSSLPRTENIIYNYNYRGIPCYPPSPAPYYSSSGVIGYKYSAPHPTQPYLPSPNPTPIDPCWYSNQGHNVEHINNNFVADSSLNIDPYYSARTPVVDPVSQRITPTLVKENRMSATLPRNVCIPPPSTVLLPSQTYPDNSLMRTQSLGNVGSYNLLSDKRKEKEWYESSLDSSPTPSRHQKPDLASQPAVRNMMSPVPHPVREAPTPEPSPAVATDITAESNAHQAVVNSIHFDTVVPYESPKNHTIIEAGKWQPYREVTKPFEMSDFYKYSTKYRKGKTSPCPSNQASDRPVQQQKIVYKPLKPQECQPLLNKNNSVPSMSKPPYPGESIANSSAPSDESMPWYCEKRPVSSSATIV